MVKGEIADRKLVYHGTDFVNARSILAPSAGEKARADEQDHPFTEQRDDQADNALGSEDSDVRAEPVVKDYSFDYFGRIVPWLPPCLCTQPTKRMNMIIGETMYRCYHCLSAHPDQQPYLSGDHKHGVLKEKLKDLRKELICITFRLREHVLRMQVDDPQFDEDEMSQWKAQMNTLKTSLTEGKKYLKEMNSQFVSKTKILVARSDPAGGEPH